LLGKPAVTDDEPDSDGLNFYVAKGAWIDPLQRRSIQ